MLLARTAAAVSHVSAAKIDEDDDNNSVTNNESSFEFTVPGIHASRIILVVYDRGILTQDLVVLKSL